MTKTILGLFRARGAGELRDGAAAGGAPVILLWLMYLVWLPFIIPPTLALLGSRDAPHVAWTLLGAALFVAVYVWTGWHNAHGLTRRAPPAARPEWRLAEIWLPIVVMTLLSLVLVETAGVGWGCLFVFTCAATTGRLPAAQALGALGALLLLVVVGGFRQHMDAATFGNALFTMSVVGVTVISSTRALAATVAANRALRVAREELARLAVAEERLRFARDLHDLLGHTLSLIALKSELAGRLVRTAPERAAAEVGDVEDAARTALREVREAVAGYRRPTLAGELGAARELLAAAAVALAQSGDLGELPPDAEAALAWAVREAVTNVIRHSRARRCSIALTRAGGRVAVEICDDGRAPAGGADGAGSGLRGLAERVEGLGGAVEAGPRARGGFRLAVSLPAEMDDGAGRLAEDERAEAS